MSEFARSIREEPRQDAVLRGGRLAAASHLELVPAPEVELPDFDENEVAVFSLISHGQTMRQIATQLRMGRQNVLNCREGVLGDLGTNSLSAGVHQLIRHGVIPVEVTPDSVAVDDLSKLDQRLLKFWAAGVSEYALARHPSVSLNDIRNAEKGLLERVGAWNRPQGVRRGHELGILS